MEICNSFFFFNTKKKMTMHCVKENKCFERRLTTKKLKKCMHPNYNCKKDMEANKNKKKKLLFVLGKTFNFRLSKKNFFEGENLR